MVSLYVFVPFDYTDEDLVLFKSWLDAIDCGQYFDRFVGAGYDFAFTAKVRGGSGGGGIT